MFYVTKCVISNINFHLQYLTHGALICVFLDTLRCVVRENKPLSIRLDLDLIKQNIFSRLTTQKCAVLQYERGEAIQSCALTVRPVCELHTNLSVGLEAVYFGTS